MCLIMPSAPRRAARLLLCLLGRVSFSFGIPGWEVNHQTLSVDQPPITVWAEEEGRSCSLSHTPLAGLSRAAPDHVSIALRCGGGRGLSLLGHSKGKPSYLLQLSGFFQL